MAPPPPRNPQTPRQHTRLSVAHRPSTSTAGRAPRGTSGATQSVLRFYRIHQDTRNPLQIRLADLPLKGLASLPVGRKVLLDYDVVDTFGFLISEC